MKNLRGFEEVIKNNKSKNQNKKPKYAMRKLTVGLVSCMMGYLIAFTPSVSNAAEVGTENVAPKEAAPEETNAGVEKDQTPKEAISPAGETSEAISANPTTEKAVAPNKDSQPAGELNTSKENAPQAETASEEVVKKQADSFNASIKDITVKENQEINYKDAVENLPQDAKLEVLTPAKTDNIGESIVKAKILFSDGSEKEIKIKVTVKANDELSANSQATEATKVAKRRVPRAASSDGLGFYNVNNEVNYDIVGEKDGVLDYGRTDYVKTDSNGDIHLNVSKWAKGSTDWGDTEKGPYNGRYILNFFKKEFYSQIQSIEVNGVQFESESDGALWKVPINTQTFKSGSIGIITNDDVVIKLKNGQTLNSLGLSNDKISFTTLWVRGDGYSDVGGHDNGFILKDNPNIPELPTNPAEGNESYLGTGLNGLGSDGAKSKDGNFTEGAMTKVVLYDAKNKAIKSVVSFKPGQNFLQANSGWVLYINDAIPKELLPYIDTNNVKLGVSDSQGKFTKDEQVNIVVDE
ncbi:Rib/alpha-like domain-containing protein, partial [Anaerococcus porci]|uniref:Rib/alpha-like domain-containing protein n=1 Tax=Anaerococcus porci TaxID=2652269 RepID=UPI002A74F343